MNILPTHIIYRDSKFTSNASEATGKGKGWTLLQRPAIINLKYVD